MNFFDSKIEKSINFLSYQKICEKHAKAARFFSKFSKNLKKALDITPPIHDIIQYLQFTEPANLAEFLFIKKE